MSWRICLNRPTRPDEISIRPPICFDIPILVDRGFPKGPPGPTEDVFTSNVRALATIDRIAEMLPAELSHDIQRSVATHMKSLCKNLGPEVTLSRHTQKEAVAA
jgi:hypothetical protein